MHMYVRMKNVLPLYNHCVKLHTPISMIMLFTAWAQTATLIQIISSLLTVLEMQCQGEVHKEAYENFSPIFSLMMQNY